MANHLANLAITAMQHPQGLKILELVSSMDVATVPLDEKLTEPDLPHIVELQAHRVDTSNPQLQKVAKEYPERLQTAVNAWLRWAKSISTEIEYPTLSLVRAIQKDWRL